MPDFVVTIRSGDREEVIEALEGVAWFLRQAPEIPLPRAGCGGVTTDDGRLIGTYGLEASRGE